MPERFDQSDPAEDPEAKNRRMAAGNISEEEIRDYLKNPEAVLFEHVLTDKKTSENVPIKVRCLTKIFLDSTLENLKDSWDAPTFENLKTTLKKHFEQKESDSPRLLNAEYYIATDKDDRPVGMTGLYTIDIEGGAGFATRDKIGIEKHHLNVGLGWYSVGKDFQGIGLGKFLLGWSENSARARGASHMIIETDDWENSKTAVKMYKKSGYKEGYPVKDFYGPGRDLNAYYYDCAGKKIQPSPPVAEITEENKKEILKIARESYPPEKLEEFEACLDLLLAQNKNLDAILNGRSLVLPDAAGQPEGFAILVEGVYENETPVFWMGVRKDSEGAKTRLLSAIKSVAKTNGRNVVVINSEGEDHDMESQEFSRAKHGIPGVFAKGDPSRFLLFYKSFRAEK